VNVWPELVQCASVTVTEMRRSGIGRTDVSLAMTGVIQQKAQHCAADAAAAAAWRHCCHGDAAAQS